MFRFAGKLRSSAGSSHSVACATFSTAPPPFLLFFFVGDGTFPETEDGKFHPRREETDRSRNAVNETRPEWTETNTARGRLQHVQSRHRGPPTLATEKNLQKRGRKKKHSSGMGKTRELDITARLSESRSINGSCRRRLPNNA